jgi:hypothetical protein
MMQTKWKAIIVVVAAVVAIVGYFKWDRIMSMFGLDWGKMIVTPATATYGGVVSVTATGLTPNMQAGLSIQTQGSNSSILLVSGVSAQYTGPAQTDAKGNFAATFVAATNIGAGLQTVTLKTADGDVLSGTFTLS